MPSSACDWSSDVCSSDRSEEHTSELQSRSDLVCRLLLEKKKAKNTILAWERKFVDLHRVLFLYTLVHEFLAVVIEGVEAYAKVYENVPPDQSLGWTVLFT